MNTRYKMDTSFNIDFYTLHLSDCIFLIIFIFSANRVDANI